MSTLTAVFTVMLEGLASAIRAAGAKRDAQVGELLPLVERLALEHDGDPSPTTTCTAWRGPGATRVPMTCSAWWPRGWWPAAWSGDGGWRGAGAALAGGRATEVAAGASAAGGACCCWAWCSRVGPWPCLRAVLSDPVRRTLTHQLKITFPCWCCESLGPTSSSFLPPIQSPALGQLLQYLPRGQGLP